MDNFEATKCQRRQLYIQGFSNLQSYRKHPDGAGDLSTKTKNNAENRARGHLDERCERLPDDHASHCCSKGNHGQYRLHRGYSKRFQDPDRPPKGVAIERRNTPARPWTAP